MAQGSWCRVQGSGFRVQGRGFRVQARGLWVAGVGCKVVVLLARSVFEIVTVLTSYGGTSLIRNRFLGPHSRPVPRALGWS